LLFTLKGIFTTAAMVWALLAAWPGEDTQEQTARMVEAAERREAPAGTIAALDPGGGHPGAVAYAAQQY
jgi:hypothetical protein